MTTIISASAHLANCRQLLALQLPNDGQFLPSGVVPKSKFSVTLSQEHLSSRFRNGGRKCAYAGRELAVPLSSSKETGPLSPDDESASPSTSTVDVKAVEDIRGGLDVGAEAFSLLQTRRFWLGTSVATLVALGGNLGGLTSAIFNTNPDFSRSVRADLLFPVKGFKRCLETSQGFEFVYPSNWVGDQRLVYRAVERAERERSLDLPPIQGERQRNQRRSSDPIVAFGPPGTEGELNVSVVVAPVFPGFSLQKIGGPQEAGERILNKFIAPEGSNKVATLLTAQQRSDGSNLYYTLEFTVKGPTFFRHNLSVYSTSNNLLFSLNAQSPEKEWSRVQNDFIEIANSFKLLST
ncbi:photosystem II oxygen-evolving enhancer protein 2 [Marchantia polymorpha subsp. ruderalis]|uniref:PsbP C-terminal domain-containing protein n=2 Tax=Marchantia polymorpha TaxID=3197 RepID=A0AAF6BHS3_MARPO|nr:hypothetical protein MARPO_0092s0016 [Marchantia polymorpha]BBN11557.1 hypothetical protein Mp_5g12920 [Marchantia polymorpha subsp. ruderalis]|eukprot:PTQ33043.1 hypothetical protein MARPO_0092s0016 [Marchantia polymorpha]